MEDIKVEELVRTKKGKIEKVKTVNRYEIVTKHNNDNDDISEGINYYAESGLEINKADITKHSFNLIDLIEVGDILELKEGNSICYLGLRQNEITVNYHYLIESIKNKDCELLSILAHEQYEQNCYKIEN